MPKFAIYLHPETCAASKPVEQITFVGHALPYFESVRQELVRQLPVYPNLPLREADGDLFATVHSKDYLDKLGRMAADLPVEEKPRLSMECSGYWYLLLGYRYGLGGMIEAIDRMKASTLERAYVFSLGGHHAHVDWGHGYCLLNPLAAAARYAQSQGFRNILLVDWDIHHGDGTQEIFANDPSIYCISIHSGLDLYMATQRVLREGTTSAAKAVGHCNIPLVDPRFADEKLIADMGLSSQFYLAHESIKVFQSALEHLPFTPDFIGIFSGYDSHKDDCGKGITEWDYDDFRTLTRCVLDLAQKAGCPVLSVHGGGYNLPVTAASAAAHIETLAMH
jgi:acetoin utilization deacetylase AcuC-like enzyme